MSAATETRKRSAAPARWATFEKRYRREMQAPPAQRVLTLLALLSRDANFSVGCYCDDERHCHRSILRDLLTSAGAALMKPNGTAERR